MAGKRVIGFLHGVFEQNDRDGRDDREVVFKQRTE